MNFKDCFYRLIMEGAGSISLTKLLNMSHVSTEAAMAPMRIRFTHEKTITDRFNVSCNVWYCFGE
ncbi:hypothetical protein VCR3J2_350086 [Vibrio coralliirubri]|nr:hypothetical protein VCR6J2_250121 [Vibrio coralliirubri]CDT90432.1 hypothetical protein VCR3J2_350086 [Vibrio coralliirubri]